jgi:hypothetical protein
MESQQAFKENELFYVNPLKEYYLLEMRRKSF